jgi:hypothetical protein
VIRYSEKARETMKLRNVSEPEVEYVVAHGLRLPPTADGEVPIIGYPRSAQYPRGRRLKVYIDPAAATPYVVSVLPGPGSM